MRIAIIGLTVALSLLTACTMIPDYQRFEQPVVPKWPDGLAYQADGEQNVERAPADIGWRRFYEDDSVLTELVTRYRLAVAPRSASLPSSPMPT